MKLNRKLSLTGAATQRRAVRMQPEFSPVNPLLTDCPRRARTPFDLLMARNRKPVRIVSSLATPPPVLRGDKSYLRALRAAEMAIWNANPKFPTFTVLLLALLLSAALPTLAVTPQPPQLTPFQIFPCPPT